MRRTSGHEAAEPSAPELPPVLTHRDSRAAENPTRAQQEAVPGRRMAGTEQQVGDDPGERAASGKPEMLRPLPSASQVRRDGPRGMSAVEGAEVGGLGRMNEVAGGEHTGPGRAEAGIDQRPEAPRVQLAGGHHRELVVRDPIRREDHQVAVDLAGAAGVELGELDRGNSVDAADIG